jgi:hypothetical protein
MHHHKGSFFLYYLTCNENGAGDGFGAAASEHGLKWRVNPWEDPGCKIRINIFTHWVVGKKTLVVTPLFDILE